MTYHAGDKPGAGAYRCLNCGYIVHVESDDQEACPFAPTAATKSSKRCRRTDARTADGAQIPARHAPRAR